MSFIPVLQYGFGIAFFGFIYWIMDAVVEEFIQTGLAVSGNAYNLMWYVWAGILIVYLIFGGWWVVRKYNEDQYLRGGMF